MFGSLLQVSNYTAIFLYILRNAHCHVFRFPTAVREEMAKYHPGISLGETEENVKVYWPKLVSASILNGGISIKTVFLCFWIPTSDLYNKKIKKTSSALTAQGPSSLETILMGEKLSTVVKPILNFFQLQNIPFSLFLLPYSGNNMHFLRRISSASPHTYFSYADLVANIS